MARLNNGSIVRGDLTIEDILDVNGNLDVSGTATVNGNEVHHDGNASTGGGGRSYEVVDSINDSDGTTPLNINLTVPDPQAYETYRLIGYIWGSNYSQGEGGEIPIEMTVNDYSTAVYEYTTLGEGTLSWSSGQAAWRDQIWRRYKNPIDFTISADSDPSTASDGNDSIFTTITSNNHEGHRGLLNGRIGGGYAAGGHPFGTLNSFELTSTDNLEAKLVLYGFNWKADL